MSSAPLTASVRTWGEMVKFSHSVFALPFAVMGAFLAGRSLDGRGWPYPGQLALIVVCMVAARSVAMTFNRIVDAELDARNPRTAGRPLPSGRITRAAAYAMMGLFTVTFGIACLGFFVWFGNSWPMLLSGPVLVYLCAYSLTKRFTRYSHFVLGSGIAIAPVAAWLAVDPASVGWPAVLLMASVTCWIAGFDIIYSCQDIEVDRRDRLHSLPSRIGARRTLWMARACHAGTVAAWIGLGLVAHLGGFYWAGVAIATSLLVVENRMVSPTDFSRVNVAFFTMNGVVSLVLAGLTVIDVLIRLPVA